MEIKYLKRIMANKILSYISSILKNILMKKLVFTLLSVYGFQLVAFSQQEATTISGKKAVLYEDGTWLFTDSIPLYNLHPAFIDRLEIPKSANQETIISHSCYSLVYNETHEQANWVAYQLTSKEVTQKVAERVDKFKSDPKVKTKTANDKDYTNSGYDRGHLAPAADMCWSLTAMNESFYYSNICPQEPGCNRGVWKRLEDLVRGWAVENDSIYVITGPVLTPGLSSIGANKVSVPKHFYKIILDYSPPGIKGIGFIVPNTSSNEPLQVFAVTIDSIETLTSLDFFPLLPDEQEKIIEGAICIKCWNWKKPKVSIGDED